MEDKSEMFRQGWKTTLGARFGLMRCVAAATLLLVAGCAGPNGGLTTAISYNQVESAYSPGEVGYAADGRDLRVVVRGKPFAGADRAELEAAVIDGMANQPGWFVTNYTTTPNETARDLYRVVWLFGVTPQTSRYAICGAAPGDFVALEQGGNTVMAGFCRLDQPLTYLGGTLGDVRSLDDPRFRRFVTVATHIVFPRLDPNRDGRSREDLDR
ncbi:MAG: hypothetical protein ACE5H8_08460 [Alphaproteobacteria bacterium]